MGHRNICCDGCQRTNFRGRRYKCLRCDNYDLCGECYDNGIISYSHERDHPMQVVLDFRYRELYFSGEGFDEMHLPNCYTCPYCGSTGHTAKRFIEHVIIEHRRAEGYVICPMCVSMPNMEVVHMRSLWRHLQRAHLQHAHLLDPNGPILRRRISRRSRRRFGASAAVSSFLSGESEPAFDMLIQMAESRRPRHHLAIRVPSERRAALDGLEVFEEHRVTPAILGPYSSISPEGRAAATDCPSTGSIKSDCKNDETASSVVSGSSDTYNFLLPQLLSHLITEENTKNNMNLKLVKRANFVEQLLISTITQDELKLPCELNEQDMETQTNENEQKEHFFVEKTNIESSEASNSTLNEENKEKDKEKDKGKEKEKEIEKEKEKVIVENASQVADYNLVKKSLD